MVRRYLALIGLVLLSLSIIAAHPAQDTAITYQRYDVTIRLEEDGSFLVRETYVLRFDDVFSEGFAEIPTAYTEQVIITGFYEGETPYVQNGSGPGSYRVSHEVGSLYVDWEYTPTTPGDERTFSVEYRVQGGLWVYPDGQILRWRAIPADRSGIPISASQVVVELPASVNPADVMALSGGASAEVRYDGQRILYEAGPIPDGEFLQVEVTLPPDTFPITPPTWQEVEDQRALDYRIERMDVTLTFDADGTVTVEERQTINIVSGVLYGLERIIQHRFVDGVEVLGVWEGDLPFKATQTPCEGCYQVKSTATAPGWVEYYSGERDLSYQDWLIGETQVSWDFPPLREQRTTFVLRYRLRGALRITSDAQSLVWTAIPSSGREVTVDRATVRVVLPPGVSKALVKLEGGVVTWEQDNTALITYSGFLSPYQSWDVSITLPPQATSATKAAWQRDVEQAEVRAQSERQRRAWLQIGTVVGSLLLFIGVAGGALLAWYLWGRDAPVGAVADVLPRPPSDLAPGIVAYLLKEEATAKGALASLFHLGSLGLLTISFKGKDLFLQRTYNAPLAANTPVQLNEQETVSVAPHQVQLFNALLPHIPPEGTTLSRIYSAFVAALPKVYEAMAQEASVFFAGRPDRVRANWRAIASIVLLGGLGLLWVGITLLGRDMGSLACAPGLAVIVGSVGLFMIAQWMPRRTSAGALEAAKWRAFCAFLADLKKHADLPNAQYMLDRYFAYAVAMDVEQVVIRHAAEMGARPPVWMLPTVIEMRDNRLYPRRVGHLASMTPAQGAATTGDGGASFSPEAMRPDLSLQSLSDRLISAINNASTGLTTVLTDATRAPGAPTTQADLDRILRTASGGGSSGYRSSSRTTWSSSSSSRSSWSSGSSFRSSGSSFRSSGSSSRSSSSSHSGGGGRRGFR